MDVYRNIGDRVSIRNMLNAIQEKENMMSLTWISGVTRMKEQVYELFRLQGCELFYLQNWRTFRANYIGIPPHQKVNICIYM